MAEERLQIIGKHNLANPSFKRTVIAQAIKTLEYLELDEDSAMNIAELVVKALSLPANEKMMVINAIAPTTANTKMQFLQEALRILPLPVSETKNVSEANSTTVTSENSQQAALRAKLREDILKIVHNLKIVPCSYFEKCLRYQLDQISCSLDTFLSIEFSAQELLYSENIVAAPGYKASAAALTNLILEENNHRPFSLNTLGNRFGLTTNEIKSKLRKHELYSFIVWSQFETWSLSDVVVSEAAKRRIVQAVALSPRGPLLLSDIFHCVFVGVIAENLYDDIDENARYLSANKGLTESGFLDFVFNKDQKAFIKKGCQTERKERALLYKVF